MKEKIIKTRKELNDTIELAKHNNQDAILRLCDYYEYKIIDTITYFRKNYPTINISDEDIRQDCYMGLLLCLQRTDNFCKQLSICMYREVLKDIDYNYRDNINNVLPITETMSYNLNEDNIIEYADFKKAVEYIKHVVSPKEYDVLLSYYIDDINTVKLGKIHKVSTERIRQIIQKAINKCHHSLSLSNKLDGYTFTFLYEYFNKYIESEVGVPLTHPDFEKKYKRYIYRLNIGKEYYDIKKQKFVRKGFENKK